MLKIFITFVVIISSLFLNAKILHSEKSLYGNIIVNEKSGKRCMIFGRLSKSPDHQSCIRISNPDYLVFSYTKLVMAGLALQPKPKSILIIGLGGGTLPLILEKLYPATQIDTVEINPAVVKVAKKWFGYQESELQKTKVQDARVFVKRQIRKHKAYDLIILDAFNGDYIPEHLMTREFLSEIKHLLTEDGLLVANTFSRNKLYNSESVTYQKVFGSFNYIHSSYSGNRIIYALKSDKNYDFQQLKDSSIRKQLESIGVDLYELSERALSKPDWDQKARTLTDQYSPANLLNQ